MATKGDLGTDADRVRFYSLRELSSRTADVIAEINSSGMRGVITRHGRVVAIIYPSVPKEFEAQALAGLMQDAEVRSQLLTESAVGRVSTTQMAAKELDLILSAQHRSPEGSSGRTREEIELVDLAKGLVKQLQRLVYRTVVYSDYAMEQIRALPPWMTAEILRINVDELAVVSTPSPIEGFVEGHAGLMWRRAVRRAISDSDSDISEDDPDAASNYVSLYRLATDDEMAQLKLDRRPLLVVSVMSNRDLANVVMPITQ
jgi:antitoxin (DNA-binding transcriptional repressor) of toxin-antitoxin stability system